MKYITLPKDYAETEGCFTGWFPDTHSGVVKVLADNVEINLIARHLNLEKVNTGFQYRKKYAGENIFTIKFSLKTLFIYLDHNAYSSQHKWGLRLTKDINKGRLFFGAEGLVNNDVTIEFEKIILRIPRVTPSVHVEPQLLKQIISDKKAKAYVMVRKINSITIGNESRYEWEISKLLNNPRFVFIDFKDTTNADSILHNNSNFISFGGGNNQLIKSLQLHVDNIRYPQISARNIYPAFDLYERMTNKFGNISPLDIHDSDNLATIFCFDLSASEELLKQNGVNVKLIIEKNNFLCQAFAFYLEDNVYSIDYKKGFITSETA